MTVPLRKRLAALLRNHKKIAAMKIENTSAFVEDVVNTRNFLIHQDDILKDNAKRRGELHQMCEKLKFLMVICLLSEMDIQPDLIKTFITQ